MPHPLTKCSVFISMHLDEFTEKAAVGTGFTIKWNKDWFLVTNLHCVTGRHFQTNEPLAKNGVTEPEYIKVHFNKKLGGWSIKSIRIRDENLNPLYLQHETKASVDVAIIKLENYEDVEYYNIFEYMAEAFDKSIIDTCSIIGFPQGFAAGGMFPIWKTGNFASELDLPWNDYPVILVDVKTREGMSGSPVVCIKKNISINDRNVHLMDNHEYINFLGVYGGRVVEDMDIGIVWKGRTIVEIIRDYYTKQETRNVQNLNWNSTYSTKRSKN